ncbi:probable 28S ribosomal protein S26, mitochondrial [Plutella xylostella]|uniref:probable 28S ribosomal protein S26, mitochondrial n=1 Tax=Plutella xylostella TaxID=51655 RepID=UPI0020323452|nr:probable 28S ribosomal protein S26, mitochondrial [Plutella xylostella]
MISQNQLLKRALPLIVQSASAHRKPRWLPVAKSRMFRIPKRPEIPEEEKKELLRLHNNYKTQMRAIKRFYFEEKIKENSSLQSASSEMSQKLEAEDWERCVALNEQWNAQVATEREERRRAELEKMEAHALQRMEAKDRELEKRIERASEEIRKQKELSATFITPETLDAAIDKALDNPIDYNFAIDLRGNKIEGRDTPPYKNTEDKREAASN